MSWCLLAELKTELGIAVSADDTLLQQCLDDAQAFIEGPEGAGRLFQVAADTTRHFDAVQDVTDDGRTLWLDEDLCAITSVTNGDSTTVGGASYVANPRNRTPSYSLTLKDSTGLTWTYATDPENAITIVGKWGWSTSAPADIHKAHKRLAGYYYRQKTSQIDIDRPMLVPGGTTILPMKVPADVMVILDGYRKKV